MRENLLLFLMFLVGFAVMVAGNPIEQKTIR